MRNRFRDNGEFNVLKCHVKHLRGQLLAKKPKAESEVED